MKLGSHRPCGNPNISSELLLQESRAAHLEENRKQSIGRALVLDLNSRIDRSIHLTRKAIEVLFLFLLL